MKKIKLLSIALIFLPMAFSAHAQYVTSIDGVHTVIPTGNSPFDSIIVKVDLTLNSIDLIQYIKLNYGKDTLDSQKITLTYTKNAQSTYFTWNGGTFPVSNNKVTLNFVVAQSDFYGAGFLQVASSNTQPPLRVAVLNGFVRDKQFRNIRKNVVSLFKYNGATYDFDHSIPADSNFSLVANEVGKYLVLVQSDTTINGQTYLPTYYETTTDWQSAIVVNVSPMNHSNLLIVYLVAATPPVNTTWNTGNAVISGTLSLGANNLRVAAGNTATQAVVYLVSQSGEKLSYQVTDATGKFAFNHIQAGTYKIEVSYPGRDPFEQTISTTGASTDVQDISASLKPAVVTAALTPAAPMSFTAYETENGNIRVLLPSTENVSGVRIFTSNGTQVGAAKYVQTGNEVNIPENALPTGVYMLMLDLNGTTSSGRILKY